MGWSFVGATHFTTHQQHKRQDVHNWPQPPVATAPIRPKHSWPRDRAGGVEWHHRESVSSRLLSFGSLASAPCGRSLAHLALDDTDFKSAKEGKPGHRHWLWQAIPYEADEHEETQSRSARRWHPAVSEQGRKLSLTA